MFHVPVIAFRPLFNFQRHFLCDSIIALYRALLYCDATSVHDRATKLLFVLPKVVNGL